MPDSCEKFLKSVQLSNNINTDKIKANTQLSVFHQSQSAVKKSQMIRITPKRLPPYTYTNHKADMEWKISSHKILNRFSILFIRFAEYKILFYERVNDGIQEKETTASSANKLLFHSIMYQGYVSAKKRKPRKESASTTAKKWKMISILSQTRIKKS